MKRISVLSLLVICTGFITYAQMGNVTKAEYAISEEKYEKAIENIELAILHPKSMHNPRTWLVRGKVYQAIGSSEDEAVLALTQDPLGIALTSYKKAKELDTKNKLKVQFTLNAPMMQNVCTNKGIVGFEKKDFESALKYFEYALETGNLPGLDHIVDTSLMYNAGIAAINCDKYEVAIEHLGNAAKYGYADGNAYVLMKNSYMVMGDTITAIETLKKGMENHPDNSFIIVDLVNYYLAESKTEEALTYLAIAKEKEPDNPTYCFAEGTLYERSGDKEKAFAAYTKATEVDPEYYDAYYNLGVMFYNNAVEMNEAAMDISDNQEYAKAKKAIDEEFKRSIPYLEKAHEIQPDNITNMETLSSLYFRLEMEDEHAEMQEKIKVAKGE